HAAIVSISVSSSFRSQWIIVQKLPVAAYIYLYDFFTIIIDTGHNLMITEPELTANMLLSAAQ
ncbi:MAG: hypothetical protein K6B41_00730, partial [Butyrivibrio sp.]|nr:hypothetical protein [Butyrivibrio sp.]